jgi:hypothetical protein
VASVGVVAKRKPAGAGPYPHAVKQTLAQGQPRPLAEGGIGQRQYGTYRATKRTSVVGVGRIAPSR